MDSHTIYCNTWTLRLFLAKQGLFRYFLQHMDSHTIPCNSWTLTRFLATYNLTLSLVMHGLLETHGLLHYFLPDMGTYSYIISCNIWTLTLFLQHMDSHTYCNLATHELYTISLNTWALCSHTISCNAWTLTSSLASCNP